MLKKCNTRLQQSYGGVAPAGLRCDHWCMALLSRSSVTRVAAAIVVVLLVGPSPVPLTGSTQPVRARHAMDQAEVAVLVVDASDGVGKRDASIAGQAEAAGCGVVIAANKWDLVKVRGTDFAKEFDELFRSL